MEWRVTIRGKEVVLLGLGPTGPHSSASNIIRHVTCDFLSVRSGGFNGFACGELRITFYT